MFENMTQREKYLAGAVGAMVPLAIVFMGLFWFIGSYNENETTIQRLNREINKEEEKLDARQRAQQRQAYYTALSFPADQDLGDVDYVFWLRNLVEKDVKMEFQGLTRQEGLQKKVGQQVIYRQRGYKLTAKGTLDQLLSFLQEFYEFPMMHRISKVNVTPRTAGNVGEKRKIRTGEHMFDISIDVLTVDGAPESRDFSDFASIPLPRSAEAYNEKVVFRNIFGPANNTPTVDVDLPRSVYPNTEIKFRLSGQDADGNDQLQYELVDCPIPDARIEPSGSDSRTAQFVAPGLPLGSYDFQIRVADDGYPSKSSLTDVSLEVVKRPNSRPSFVTNSRLESVAGKSMQFEIEAEDDDEDNQLSFEILESDLADAELEPGEENGKVALLIPAAEPGEYSVRLKVADDAEEPDSAERNFRITVNPPEFLFASQTQITGILNSRRGDMVWIHCRPSGELFQLQTGDRFEVDKQEWTVESIDVEMNEVWIQHQNRMKLYEFHDFLSEPRKVEPLVQPVVSKEDDQSSLPEN